MACVPKRLVGASFFLPDEIVVQIISKVTDLRTLCICKLVSRCFNQISCQVDTISFMAPSSWKTNYSSKIHEHVYSLPFSKKNLSRTRIGQRFDHLADGLIESMTRFTRLKSLYIELPLSPFKSLPFLKWKLFIGGSNRINSLVVLSPTSIKRSSYVDDHEKEKPNFGSTCYPMVNASLCMEEAFARYMVLFGFARKCPFLEKITITDLCKRGRISLSVAKLSEVIKPEPFTAPPINVIDFLHKVSRCHIPLLDLPVSGFVMKGVKLILYEDVALPSGYRYDGYITHDDDDFEGKEKAAYSEAVREIFKKHKDKISPSPPQRRFI